MSGMGFTNAAVAKPRQCDAMQEEVARENSHFIVHHASRPNRDGDQTTETGEFGLEDGFERPHSPLNRDAFTYVLEAAHEDGRVKAHTARNKMCHMYANKRSFQETVANVEKKQEAEAARRESSASVCMSVCLPLSLPDSLILSLSFEIFAFCIELLGSLGSGEHEMSLIFNKLGGNKTPKTILKCNGADPSFSFSCSFSDPLSFFLSLSFSLMLIL
jgi:hypothetical protein